jgi:hypothetical protein
MRDLVGVPELPSAWRAEAERLERFAPAAATAFRDAATDLEDALRASAGELLTLAEASLASGYSADRLRHLVSSGAIANAGKKGAPRIRRADLPVRAARPALSAYNPDEDARSIASGGKH